MSTHGALILGAKYFAVGIADNFNVGCVVHDYLS
jgi:hypothetical protein